MFAYPVLRQGALSNECSPQTTSMKLENKAAVASQVSFAYLFQSSTHKANAGFVAFSKSFRFYILCFNQAGARPQTPLLSPRLGE